MAYQHREGAEEGDRENREREDEKTDGWLVWNIYAESYFQEHLQNIQEAVVFKCLFYLGRGWRRLQEADWPEEGQASSLPAPANRWVCGQPHYPGLWTQDCPGCQGKKEEEEEEEGWPHTKKYPTKQTKKRRQKPRLICVVLYSYPVMQGWTNDLLPSPLDKTILHSHVLVALKLKWLG